MGRDFEIGKVKLVSVRGIVGIFVVRVVLYVVKRESGWELGR